MQVKLTKQATPYQLRLVEEANVVKELMEKEYEKIAPRVEVRGFRKGHAPRKEAEKQPFFNKFDLYRGIFDDLYRKALEQEKLDVVDSSEFEIMGPFEDTSPLVMQAKVYLKPKVVSFDMSKVAAVKKMTDITEQMIDDQVKAKQSQAAKYTNVIIEGYEVKTGDMMIVSYTGKIDGKEFDGGTAKSFKYIIGETKFIPGFEDQLKLMKANQTKTIKATFPDDYPAVNLKGKTAEFETTVHKIESRELKTIEQLATEQNQSVQDYRQTIYNKLVEDYKRIDQENFESDILSQCILQTEFEPIPEAMIKYEVTSEWNQLLYRMGMTEEQYLKKFPQGKDSFFSQKHKRVQKTIEIRMFLDHVCEKYNVTATKDEVIKFVKDRGEKLNKSAEDMKSILANIDKEINYKATEQTVKHEKVMAILMNEMAK